MTNHVPPVASIIIPAHNEAGVIAECLHAIVDEADPREFEVVVVCNGCTDDTAAIARRVSPLVRVIERAQPGKIGALNEGDAISIAFPRVYLDADVIVDTASLRLIAATLSEGEVEAAAPQIEMNVRSSSWIVRSYYKVWADMDWADSSVMGSGCYALSERGRQRFGLFPDVMADDYWVNAQFPRQARRRVEGASSKVLAARNLRLLIRRKARVLAYARLLDSQSADIADQSAPRGAGLLAMSLGNPRRIPTILLYVMVAIITNGLAAWNLRRGRFEWVTDR
ncbi:MAG: glycosyltransferase [Microthrixaceae bacterium]